MTVEEALTIAESMESCFIVWRTDTGEIVSVESSVPGGQPMAMASKAPYPRKGRFLTKAMVSRELFEAEEAACFTTNRRVSIFESWVRASSDRLVEILEVQEFEEPYVHSSDADYLIKLLVQLRADELIYKRRDLRIRLGVLADSTKLDSSTQRILKLYLAIADLDAAEVKSLWKRQPEGKSIDYVEPFGDVRTEDSEVIDWLIEIVEKQIFFGPRLDATLALGKIGVAAGEKACEIICKSISPRSSAVRNLRELVVQRITTPKEWWVRCSHCHRGRVLKMKPYVPWPAPCEVCHGIGLVQRAGRR